MTCPTESGRPRASNHVRARPAGPLHSRGLRQYGDDEQYTAFLTVFEVQATLPTTATILGTPVTVIGFDYTKEAHGVIATCHGPDGAGEVAIANLTVPPDRVTAWVHAAYRRHLGLRPFPARPRPDWTWPD